ncbi:SHOCT domain-containing protein [Candidatus Saccharibacteria bacterium]|nr:SHOCT domain-containing protein [Candidatus Saccharibacteria bacterium]
MSQYTDLKKIKELLDDGVLSKAEYEEQKEIILNRDYEAEAPRHSGSSKPSANGDAPSGGYLALGLFFPLIGLILFLVWINEYPKRAKSAGKGALIGTIIYIVLCIIVPIIIVNAAVSSVYNNYWY